MCIRDSYTIVWVHGNGEAEGPKSEARRAERNGILGKRIFPIS